MAAAAKQRSFLSWRVENEKDGVALLEMFHMLGYGMETAMIPLSAWFGIRSGGLNTQTLALFECIAPGMIPDGWAHEDIRDVQAQYSREFSITVGRHQYAKKNEPKNLSRRQIIWYEDLARGYSKYHDFVASMKKGEFNGMLSIWSCADRQKWVAKEERDLKFILLMMMFGVYNPVYLGILFSKLEYMGNRENYSVMALFDGLLEGVLQTEDDHAGVRKANMGFSAEFKETLSRHRALASLCNRHVGAISDWTHLHKLESAWVQSMTLGEFCSNLGRGDDLAQDAWKAFGL